MTFRFSETWLPNGIQTLAGTDLLLLVSDAPYSPSAVFASDIASTEVGSRVPCTGAPLREEAGWQLGLDDLGTSTVTDDGQSYYLVLDADTDAERQIVGGSDASIPAGTWEPSFDDGAIFLPFENRAAVVEIVQGPGVSVDSTDPQRPVVGGPAGGLTGQALVKASDANGDFTWATITGGGGGQTGPLLLDVIGGVADASEAQSAAGLAVLPSEPFTLNLPAPEEGKRLAVLIGAPPEALAGFTVAGTPVDALPLNQPAPDAEFFAVLLVPIPDFGDGPSWSVTYTPQAVASSWEATLFFGDDLALDNGWSSPSSAAVKVEQYEADRLLVLYGELTGGTTTTLIEDVTGTPLEGNPFRVVVAGLASSSPAVVVLELGAYNPPDPQPLTATVIGGGTPDAVYLDGVTLIR